MSSTVIGITTYGRNKANHYTIPSEYVDSVRRSGATAMLLPPGERDISRWLEIVDAIILIGGGDLDPAHYGEPAHETVYMIDEERDLGELELARKILDSGLPTLGICRGAQVINVALGGTLHVHLPDVVGEEVLHRLPPREPGPHPIRVSESSRLAEILGETEFDAESWHHQAIKDVAPSLRVVAHAPDGVIEAFEKHDHPWLYAVQWHPELSAATDPIQQRLFDALTQAALKLRGDTR